MDNPSLQLDPALHSFLESCLEDKGLKDLQTDLREQMTQDLASRLQTWLLQAVFMQLEEKDMPQVDALIEKGASQEEITQLLRKLVPNIDQIFEKEMLAFKKAYIEA